MSIQVWYLDTYSEWQLFYEHYGQEMAWALEDARKTLGIDIWAVARDGIVLACSKDAWGIPQLKSRVATEQMIMDASPEWIDAYLRMHGYDPEKLAADMQARIAPLLESYRSS